MGQERDFLIMRGATGKAEHDKLCKELRDRWLARKNGLLTQIDEHWLKPTPKELKPAVGRQFNELRKASSVMEVANSPRKSGLPASPPSLRLRVQQTYLKITGQT